MPVYTGERLLGEHESPIEIPLVNARSDQIVDTGPESAAKLKILGFRVGDSNISFTHSEEDTRNGLYRLVAVVGDADLMNGVEVAMTEAFVMKDWRYIYHEKHTCPSLSDKGAV
ncbi:putative CALMODULIN-BINDING PROTEIN60 [Helianthus annuus]|nr:putative CALMODULIN-BINDING PROTEIN60 [Helianthus annuus]